MSYNKYERTTTWIRIRTLSKVEKKSQDSNVRWMKLIGLIIVFRVCSLVDKKTLWDWVGIESSKYCKIIEFSNSKNIYNMEYYQL